MRYHCLQLVAALLLTAAAEACAQIQSPDVLGPRTPHNPSSHHSNPMTPANREWLWQFTKPEPIGQVNKLRVDARFQVLLLANFKQPQAMWGNESDRPTLAQTIPLFLDHYGEALQKDNRYFIADGCVPSFCPAAGLLWIDVAAKDPLMLFAATSWSTQAHTTDDVNAEYTLWIFANRDLSADALPFAFTTAIADWSARLAAAHRLVPHINHAMLIEPDGKPFALDPTEIGANTLPPQPDTITPKPADSE